MIAQGGGLPGQTSRFFGRSQEAAAVKGALARARLVTLTGPGGIGKTRLAVRVAAEVAPLFPDGVFVADLSAARDAADVARTVASVLGLVPEPDNGTSPGDLARGQRAVARLAASLGPRPLLLILDTAEHVADACAELADAILRGGDGPVLLVTSRQVLDLPGEMVFRIPPLAVDADAVRLFADRAAAAVPGFELSHGTRPKVVRLCRLLDGIPLAIELAALRLRAVSLDELLARLPGQLRLLTSGRRAAAGDRQRSLGASVGWSYALCTPAEQLLWTRLSAFRDGFDLAAAEAVCGPVVPGEQDDLGAPGVLETLIGLVDKSVVLRAADTGGTARYRLFAIAAEYGAEHAADAAVRAGRHRAHYQGVARAFAASFAGPGQAELVHGLTPDQANLRLAFDAAVAAGDAAAALELAAACWPWLVCTDRLAEAGSWL
ncbi:MAG TPA: AAA family ATPase, partial [Trebonia sp.]